MPNDLPEGAALVARPTVVDGYWTLPCNDGCGGTGRYQQEQLPDFGMECVACKGTGKAIVALAAPAPHEWVTTLTSDLLCVRCGYRVAVGYAMTGQDTTRCGEPNE